MRLVLRSTFYIFNSCNFQTVMIWRPMLLVITNIQIAFYERKQPENCLFFQKKLATVIFVNIRYHLKKRKVKITSKWNFLPSTKISLWWYKIRRVISPFSRRKCRRRTAPTNAECTNVEHDVVVDVINTLFNLFGPEDQTQAYLLHILLILHLLTKYLWNYGCKYLLLTLLFDSSVGGLQCSCMNYVI